MTHKITRLIIAVVLMYSIAAFSLSESEVTMPYIPQVKVGNTVYDVKDTEARNQIKDHNIYVFPLTKKNTDSRNGITYSYVGNNTFQVSGMVTGNTFYNAYDYTLSELGMTEGDTIYVHAESSDPSNVIMQLWATIDGNSTTINSLSNDYYGYTIPDGCTSILFRIFCLDKGVQFSANIKCEMISEPKDDYLNFALRPVAGSLPNGTDLNEVVENGAWMIDGSNQYTNIPATYENSACYLLCLLTGGQVFQIIIRYPSAYSEMVIRVNNTNTSQGWRPWKTLSSGEYGIDSDIYGLGFEPGTPEYQQEEIDLNTIIRKNHIYMCADAFTFLNGPVGWSGLGFLQCYFTGNWNLQVIYPFTGNKLYKRRGKSDGTVWEEWQEIAGGENTYNVTNEYSFPKYSESLTVNATPSITTDTHNYLAPVSGTTDRTADILSMLNNTGICHLGPGTYYVKNLIMPDNSSIIGDGFSTILRLSDDADATFAVAPKSHCIIKDLKIVGGADGTVTPSSTIGDRHGIMWQGDYTESHTAPYQSILDNLYILNFTGGGITCYDTGYGTTNCIEATNIYIDTCSAGINISYWSEFHKFTNVRCSSCYYGCVNNGGNNLFVNCDFSSNRGIAMLMDNSQGQSPNNTHGSCVGCVFNHTASNTGIGIEILNCHSGFVFTGCQIFYSQIHLVDSEGIIISDTNFGNNNCSVSISGGGTVLFSGCMVEGAIPITIDNNQKVHFSNCYNKATGATWGN